MFSPFRSIACGIPLPIFVLMACWSGLLYGAPSAIVTTPAYVSPGYIVPGNVTMGGIAATANFSLTFNSTANRTIRAYFQLLDESGNPVAITGNSTSGNQTVYSQVNQSFTANTSKAVSISTQIVPAEHSDPSRTYRVSVSQVTDATVFFGHVDLGITGTQVTGNSYVHFHGGSGVVVRMAGVALTKTHRLATSTNSLGANFTCTPRLDFYRYEPGGNSTRVSATLQVTLRDDLGTIHYQGNTSVSSLFSLTGTNAGMPSSSANSAITGTTVRFSPAQLDSVNRTYRIEAIPTFKSDGANFTCGNGTSAGPSQLLDFNGSRRFGSIATTFTDYSNTPAAGAVSGGRIGTTIGISSANGTINGHAGQYTFGDGTALSVGLAANGTAYYTGGSAVAVNSPANDSQTKENITFIRQSLSLSTSGLAAGTLQVILPAGVGYRAAGS